MINQNTAVQDGIISEQASTFSPKIYQLYVPTQAQKRYLVVKRFLDTVLSVIALIVLLPLMLLSLVAIKIDSPGPTIFKQKRIGKNGKAIVIYKFRTMLLHSPSHVATAQLEDADQYITRVGKFLRKTSIDELPQLGNIIRGDMSIIGPRPLIVDERNIHSMRYQQGVYFLRPGLAGLAQINGRDLVNPEEKVKFDAEYLHTFSFKTDIKVLIKTIRVVFQHTGYAEGKQG